MESIKEKRKDATEVVTMKVEVEMFRTKSRAEGISGMGYDALLAILELETCGGEVWWFYDVPEYIWYKWRSAENQTAFFYTYIAGKFKVEQVL